MLRSHAKGDFLRFHLFCFQTFLLLSRKGNLDSPHLDAVSTVFFHQLRIKEVHLGHTDEACNKQVIRMIEYLLRSSNLLDDTILHDDDAVAQGHSLCLVMSNIEEGGFDSLTQLNDFRTHLVTQLCVQIG